MTKLVLNLLAFTGMSHVRKKAFMILFLLGEKGKEIILRKYRKIPPLSILADRFSFRNSSLFSY